VRSCIIRRRSDGVGYKAGNIRDFLDRWGDDYDLMLGLDADSFLGASSILHMVRIVQANPMLGILQSLVVGMPSRSAFARIFQFGMRHGMRSYTMGAAWWAGDCGPYWGHNAVIRVAPFRAHCRLPVLSGNGPLSGHILSHDQIEAVLMRRAGYEVRVLPEEMESFEENPPHLTEFTRRDLRWCQGNMQYWRLLAMPGLKPMSRFQIAWAILMYLSAFAWVAFMLLAALKVFEAEPIGEPFPIALGLGPIPDNLRHEPDAKARRAPRRAAASRRTATLWRQRRAATRRGAGIRVRRASWPRCCVSGGDIHGRPVLRKDRHLGSSGARRRAPVVADRDCRPLAPVPVRIFADGDTVRLRAGRTYMGRTPAPRLALRSAFRRAYGRARRRTLARPTRSLRDTRGVRISAVKQVIPETTTICCGHDEGRNEPCPIADVEKVRWGRRGQSGG
jgi:hypothetical protein